MKLLLSLCLLILIVVSCSPNKEKPDPDNPNSYFLSQKLWLKYYHSLRFGEDFTAFDTTSSIMDKKQFYLSIMSGKYLPMRSVSGDSIYYKLYRNVNTDSEHLIFVQSLARKEFLEHRLLGKPLPNFDFTSLDGQKINAETTRDKIVAIKFWFTGCVPCVKAMPALNKLKESFQDRKDIVFLSLALNNEADLKKFLSKTEFHFTTIGDKRDYILEELDVTAFPTYMLINKKGQVIKVVDKDKMLEDFLRIEADKDKEGIASL